MNKQLPFVWRFTIAHDDYCHLVVPIVCATMKNCKISGRLVRHNRLTVPLTESYDGQSSRIGIRFNVQPSTAWNHGIRTGRRWTLATKQCCRAVPGNYQQWCMCTRLTTFGATELNQFRTESGDTFVAREVREVKQGQHQIQVAIDFWAAVNLTIAWIQSHNGGEATYTYLRSCVVDM